MSWNLEGMVVKGIYLDQIEVSGTVTLSRVCYGGEISHHVTIDEGFELYGGKISRQAGEGLIIDHKNIIEIRD